VSRPRSLPDAQPDADRPHYDHVFRNALIFDGSGAAAYPGELAVSGDRIALVGPCGTIAAGSGAAEHDLAGRALAPGFIDRCPYP
jgi:N-acyl-D-amino-acid deacylase